MIAPTPGPDAPIGVFDSGLGGLTVVRAIERALPGERVLYVADQAHVPYGGRDLGEVRSFACGISEALFAAGCKAVVMACNISSATALATVQSRHRGSPVLGVIDAGATEAIRASRSGRIGVLATEGTVRSGAYTRSLRSRDPHVSVFEVECPRFVPLVEEGMAESAAAYEAAHVCLAPLLDACVDTVILGCTHYPFLLGALAAAAPEVAFIDPAGRTVSDLGALLLCLQLASPAATAQETVLATTGDKGVFETQTDRFLAVRRGSRTVAAARWDNEGRLQIG